MFNKNIILVIMILCVLSFQIVFSQDLTFEEVQLIVQNINIDFSMFPTKNTWNNEYHVPIINTNFKREFQELIIEESRQPPNFDGKYRIVEEKHSRIDSRFFIIIDLNTGLVYDRLYRINKGIKYSIESSMIIINPIESLDFESDPFNYYGSNQIIYTKWNGQNLDCLLAINSYPNYF